MKINLTVETLKTLLEKVEEVRSNAGCDDIYVSNDDAWDYITIDYKDISKNKIPLDTLSEEHISSIVVRVKCETIYDEAISL